jgi:hypothetical protein
VLEDGACGPYPRRVSETRWADFVEKYIMHAFIACGVLTAIVGFGGQLLRSSRILHYYGYVFTGVGAGLCAGLIVFGVFQYVLRVEHVGYAIGPAVALFLAMGLGLGLPSLNLLLDTSPPVVRHVEIVSTTERTERRVKRRYAVVRSWREAGGTIEVPLPLSGPLTPGSRLALITRRGAFGWEWVERLAP